MEANAINEINSSVTKQPNILREGREFDASKPYQYDSWPKELQVAHVAKQAATKKFFDVVNRCKQESDRQIAKSKEKREKAAAVVREFCDFARLDSAKWDQEGCLDSKYKGLLKDLQQQLSVAKGTV